MTASEYINGFRANLAACRTASEANDLWWLGTRARTAAGISPGGFMFSELWLLLVDKIAELTEPKTEDAA